MAWPTPATFQSAIQHRRALGRGAVPQDGHWEWDTLGLPRARCGTFAVVYKYVHGKAARAIRVFTTPQADRAERYRVVAEHLRRGRPKCLVDFHYLDEGIQVEGAWYPLLVMPWVAGPTLGVWAAGRARDGDAALRDAAGRWADLVDDLRACQVAHGNLEPSNILVSGGRLVLVDYDTLTVPGLAGRAATEAGRPGWRHPLRGERMSLEADDFPAWLIWLGLRALAADPALVRRYPDEADDLDFLARDYSDPGHAPRWADLQASPDPEVRAGAALVLQAVRGPWESVPPFGRAELARLHKAPSLLDTLLAQSKITRGERDRLQSFLAEGEQRARQAPATEDADRLLTRVGDALPDGSPEAAPQRPDKPATSPGEGVRHGAEPTLRPGEPDQGIPPPPVTPADTTPDFDRYHFSAFYPEKVGPRAVGKLIAFGHLASLVKRVVQEAAARLELPAGVALKARGARPVVPVAREAVLQVTPDVDGLAFSPPGGTLALWEDSQSVEFRFKPQPGAEGKACQGWVHFWLEGVAVADVPVTVFVPEAEEADLLQEELKRVNARPYRAVFPSYSHEDARVVECLEAYAAAFGDAYLRDVRELRTGQCWNSELMAFIQRASVFQLFWSAKAAASKYVEQEWRFALRERSRRQDPFFVRPVYWTEKPAQPIPRELTELHFARVPLTEVSLPTR